MIQCTDLGTKSCSTHGEYTEREFMGRRMGCPVCAAERTTLEDAKQAAAFASQRAENRRQSLLAMANIPPRFQNRTFETYRSGTREQAHALKVCMRYVEVFDDCLEKGRCLVLVGRSGTGKTHLACAMAMALAEAGRAVRFCTVYKMLDEIKHRAFHAGASEHDEVARYGRYDLLILDEVGAQVGSDWERATLFKIINNRYEACLPTIMISNLPKEGFVQYVGDRVFDRMQENGGVTVPFEWDSCRGAL